MITIYFYFISKERIANCMLPFSSEIILCKPNPCLHGGQCIVISSRQFSCDCEQTGYEGNLCERGVVTPPDFPKLIPGHPSEKLEMGAKPENSLTVNLNPTMNLTIQPEKLIIQHPESKVEFQITGYTSAVGMVTYSLDGVNKYDFTAPRKSVVFIGHNVSSQDSVYTRLGLLAGELPVGCQRMDMKKFLACDFKIAFHTNSNISTPTLIESGPVHIITSDNRTIPLSLAGYDFSSPLPLEKDIMERLIGLTNISDRWQLNNQRPDCYNIGLTGKDLIEMIQKDAFSKSFLRYLTDQLPLWLRFRVREESNLFDIGNIQSNLLQTRDAHLSNTICKFPVHIQTALVLYRPMVTFNISVDNNRLSLSSKGSCFAADICEPGVFLTLSQRARKKFATMQFMQDLTLGGWELLVSSFGFSTPRIYNRSVLSSVPNGHLVGNFADFYYNWWWQGSANIDLSNADQAVNMKLSGEAFAFTENLDAVSIAFS